MQFELNAHDATLHLFEADPLVSDSPPPEKPPPHITVERKFIIVFGVYLVLSISLLLVSLAAAYHYRVNRNQSSLALIGIIIILWLWSSIMWSMFVLQPEFF